MILNALRTYASINGDVHDICVGLVLRSLAGFPCAKRERHARGRRYCCLVHNRSHHDARPTGQKMDTQNSKVSVLEENCTSCCFCFHFSFRPVLGCAVSVWSSYGQTGVGCVH